MQMPAGSDLVRSIERLPDAVAAYAEAAPDREAIIFGDLHLSYSEFDREIDRYARALIGAGIATGDRVAMIVTPRPEFMLMLLGAMRAGAVWVGVNPKYRREEMRHVLGDCQPKLLVSILQDPAGRRYDDDLRDLACDVAASAPLVTIGGILEGISQPLDAFLAAGDGLADVTDRLNRTSRRDPVSIVYTSGSTGKPKGPFSPTTVSSIPTRRLRKRSWATPIYAPAPRDLQSADQPCRLPVRCVRKLSDRRRHDRVHGNVRSGWRSGNDGTREDHDPRRIAADASGRVRSS